MREGIQIAKLSIKFLCGCLVSVQARVTEHDRMRQVFRAAGRTIMQNMDNGPMPGQSWQAQRPQTSVMPQSHSDPNPLPNLLNNTLPHSHSQPNGLHNQNQQTSHQTSSNVIRATRFNE